MVNTKNVVEQKNGTELKITPPAVKVEFPKKEEEKLQSLDDRLHRLNQLFEIQTKYNKMQASLQKLNEFEINKDGERSHISIHDDSRNDFTTYNPEIIQEVTTFLKAKIKEKLKLLEPQLKW